MILRCEACGSKNPAVNRYCGQCGNKLEHLGADFPAEYGYDNEHTGEPEAFDDLPNEPFANLPDEVIDFDNQIPLIAGEGTDRRLHPSPELVDTVHDHLQREANAHDKLEHSGETHFDSQQRQQQESRGEFWDLPLTAHEPAYDDLRAGTDQETDNAASAARDAADPDAEQPAARSFLPDGVRTSHTGVSGPSFLGLTDDESPDYSTDDFEPESNLRRNIALTVLAVAVMLVAVQWRSIRDRGLAYMQNGSMEVNRRTATQPKSPPAVAADNTNLPPDNAKSNSSQPVANSPNAGHDLPQAADSSDSAASAATAPVKQPPAMSTPVQNPDDDLAKEASKNPPAVAPVPASPEAPSATGRASIPGAEEMSHAAKASDAEARAAWLWKAVAKGNPQAPIELARMYERGDGVAQSCDQAAILLRSAAAKGSEQAKLSLQQMPREGCR